MEIHPGVSIKPYDRDFFVYRLICGKIYYEDYYIQNPSPEIIYDACIVYKEIYERCMSDGVYEDLLNVLIEGDMWSLEQEERLLKILPDQISDLKVELFESNPLSYLKIKHELVQTRRELQELYRIRHSLNQYTCGGIAELCKLKYIVEHCTFKKNGDRVDWDEISLDKIVNVYGQRYLDENTIRYLCRNDPWIDIWSSSKKNNNSLFAKDGVALSDEQRKIILWSSLYDNIKEFPDAPDSEVFDDDDRLDGWMIKKNREKEVKKIQESIKISNNPRINNAHEVFVFVKNAEEARAVDSMNNFQANLVKQSRFNKIRKEGIVDKQKFADVKQDLKIAINRKALESGR